MSSYRGSRFGADEPQEKRHRLSTARQYFQGKVRDLIVTKGAEGGVQIWDALFIIFVSIISFTFTFEAATYYRAFGSDVKPRQSTEKLWATLYACASFQVVLLIVLGLRGITFRKFFKYVIVQWVILSHIILPNLLITSLWAAQVMRDSMQPLVGSSVAFGASSKVNSHLQKAYVFHTVAMVFSNLFSAYCYAVLFSNSESLPSVSSPNIPSTEVTA